MAGAKACAKRKIKPNAQQEASLESASLAPSRILAKKEKKKLKQKLAKQRKAAAALELTRVPADGDGEEMRTGEGKGEPDHKRRKKPESSRDARNAEEESGAPNHRDRGDAEEEDGSEEGQDNEYGLQRGSHGYGVQPLGNLLLSASGRNARDVGLGSLHVLSDETVCDILGHLGGRDLARLALTSRALYVFAHQDSLWRTLVLENYNGALGFRGCWKTTFVATHVPQHAGGPHVPLKVKDFYSDFLFQSWLCASLEIKPDWLATDNIEKRTDLSVAEFVAEFEEPNRPVLLRNALASWPALEKWTREYLLRHTEGVRFAAGPIALTLPDYFRYSDGAEEERPLYIFDSQFADKAPQLALDYQVPVYFREDLFSILGEAERPDYRWLIAGPARSGSSFHIDPNSTSAWNAVVRGAKKWVMYPPETVPPGVFPSPDGADVATSVSITEWFMNFYAQTRRAGARPVECVCRAGEVVFVPRGWWHVVINLEESVAITQNFVSRSNILSVLEFLSRPNSQHLVSGTKDRVNLYEKFRSKYEALYPGSIEAIKQRAAEREAALQKSKTSIWDNAADAMTGGFKFGF